MKFLPFSQYSIIKHSLVPEWMNESIYLQILLWKTLLISYFSYRASSSSL